MLFTGDLTISCCLLGKNGCLVTGKSLSEAHIYASITLKFLLYVPVRMQVWQNITMHCRTGPMYGTYNMNFRVNHNMMTDCSLNYKFNT